MNIPQRIREIGYRINLKQVSQILGNFLQGFGHLLLSVLATVLIGVTALVFLLLWLIGNILK